MAFSMIMAVRIHLKMPSLFASGRGQQEKKEEDLTAALYQQIGQLKVELDWMKKIWS